MVVVSIWAAAAPAVALIGADDVAEAEARLEDARAEAGETAAALAAARGEETRLHAELESLVAKVAAALRRLAEARAAARESARSLYMAAGSSSGTTLDTDASATVRAIYAEALGRADRAVVNAWQIAERDLRERRRAVQEHAAGQHRLADELEALAAAAGPALAAAEADYARALALWEEQEARRAAEAAATSSTTSPAAPSNTGAGAATTGPSATTTVPSVTTTLPLPVIGVFPPPVERWRPLVAAYFAPALVDEALAVIQCESGGDPAIVNSVSGAIGLFQHLPDYWADRAAAAGFAGARPDDGEANIAAAAWLAGESMAAGLGPWYFWACRP